MKTNKTIQLLFLQVALYSAFAFTISSCDNKSKKEDSKEVAEDKNDAKMDSIDNNADAYFLVNVAEINQEEISLGKLAQEKGTTLDVKELGSLLEKAHSKALTDVSALAMQKSISLPSVKTDDVKETYKKMSEKNVGKDFDKEYSDMMVEGHKKAIEEFEKAASNSTDTDIKAFATNMLPDLRKHLEMAEMCKKKVNQ